MESRKKMKLNRRDDGWEEHGGYMKAKTQKLENQLLSTATPFQRKTDIFKGVSIWVNGFTNPSSDELKLMMYEHGGKYQHFFSKTHVTHIIATNMPESKIKDLKRNDKVVHPSWIVDSVEAGRVLQIDKYLLYSVGKRDGNVINFAKKSNNESKKKVPQSESDSVQQNAGYTNNYEQQQTQPVAPNLTHHNYSSTSSSKYTSKAGDPNFISEFYAHSRLHHLSMWKSELKKFATSIQEKQKIKKTNVAKNSKHRLIMHVDLDSFFVSVAIKKDPSLKGKPVAVCHGSGKGRGGDPSGDSWSEIASCSYEARAKGVKNGMFIFRAKELCRDLIYVPYNFDEYRNVSQTFYEILSSFTCNIEAVSCDEALLDISDLVENASDVLDFAEKLRQDILEATGCTASCGIGSNILLAKLATRKAKPNGKYFVTKEEVQKFVVLQNVKDLPGIGRAQGQKLEALGINSCADLQKWTLGSLQKEFGKKLGEKLFNYCRGKDDREIELHHERKSVSAEINYGMRFTKEEEVEKFLRDLSGEVHNRLKEINKYGNKITFKLMIRVQDAMEPSKYMGHGICDSVSKTQTLPLPTDDPSIISKNCWSLLRSLNVPPSDIRGIGIQITGLTDAQSKTSSLFDFVKPVSSAPEIIEKDLSAPVVPSLPTWEQINRGEQDRMEFKVKNNFIMNDVDNWDPSVLQELPKEIQDELASIKRQKESPITKSQQSPKNKSPHNVNKARASPAKRGRGRGRKLNDAFDPSKFGDIRNLASKGVSKDQEEQVIPPDVDMETLKELPKDLQAEILGNFRRSGKTISDNQVVSGKTTLKTPSLKIDCPKNEKSQEINMNKDNLMSPSQLDQSFLKALPDELRQEIVADVVKIKNERLKHEVIDQGNMKSSIPNDNAKTSRVHTPLSPSQLDQSFLKALPENIRTDIISEAENMKQIKTHFSRNQNTEKTSKDENDAESKSSETNRLKNNVFINDDFLSPSQVDINVLAALPAEIQKEIIISTKRIKRIRTNKILNENNTLNSKFGEKEQNDQVETIEEETDEVEMKKLKQILPALHGVSDISEVKKMLRMWIIEYPEPLDEDVQEVLEYFRLLLESYNMENLFILLKFLRRLVTNVESWHSPFNNILTHVQSNMKEKYSAPFPLLMFQVD